MLPLQDVKAKLSQYISHVEKGHIYTISKNGKPVAMLVPYIEEIDTQTGIDLIKKSRSSINQSSEQLFQLINKDRS